MNKREGKGWFRSPATPPLLAAVLILGVAAVSFEAALVVAVVLAAGSGVLAVLHAAAADRALRKMAAQEEAYAELAQNCDALLDESLNLARGLNARIDAALANDDTNAGTEEAPDARRR